MWVQICMAYVRDKFARASWEGCDRNADVFVDNIDKLYEFERGYDKEEISAEERKRRRQGLKTKEIMINLRTNLLMELRSDPGIRSNYLSEAVNYLHKFWNETFTYIRDGNYPIDNNLA